MYSDMAIYQARHLDFQLAFAGHDRNGDTVAN
jgi:hypothetical protein